MADYLEDYVVDHKPMLYPTWLKVVSRAGFTYKDYLTWDDNIRVELIDGVVHMMAGASEWHQDTVGDLFHQLKNFFKDKTCKPYVAPFDVRLFPQDDLADKTVVQPDVLVVCDKSKIQSRGVNGAPDLIIEVMSESSEAHDRITKKKWYEAAGVREYWVVGEKQIYRYQLSDGKYIETVNDFLTGFNLDSVIFPGFVLQF